MDEAKNQISDLEHKESKNKQSEWQEEKGIQKYEHSVNNLCNNFKEPNICFIGVPEGEEIGNLFVKIMKENFPNVEKEIERQVQEAQSPKQDGGKETHSKIHCN